MRIKYKDKEIEVKECKSFKDRLLGYMFYKKEIKKVLLFNKCNSIHTFFCFKALDIVMCDQEDNVLYFYSNFKPWKIILPKKKVSKVYEFPPLFFEEKIKRLTVLK